MKRYEKYKQSGIEWIGEIPEHWEMGKTKYYFKFTTGFTPPSGNEEFYNGGIDWVTIADINKKTITESTNTISSKAIKKYNPDLTKKGALLFSFKLTVGKVAFAGKDFYTNEAIISIPPKSKYSVSYFYYTLPEQLLLNANENIYGAKMLNQELIRNALICFPPLDEQTAIAKYLDEKTEQIDKFIEKKQKLIELLKEERAAVINEAVSGEGKNWERKKLKHIAYVVLGKMLTNDDKGGYVLRPYLRAANMNWFNVDICSIKEMWFSPNELENLRLRKYDLLVSEGGEVGRTCIWNDELEECYIQNSVHKVTFKKEYNPYFFLYQFFYFGSVGYFESIVNKISIGHLTREKLVDIPVFFPSLNEQYKIVTYLNTETQRIDTTISKIEKEIMLMQEYKTALISEVVTGKIKVI